MAEHIFGKNDNLDAHLLAEKSKEGFDVQGDVNVQEIDHDQVCEEFAALVGMTKMDRHWKILLMLRASGADLEVALGLAQKHGFLIGVRPHEAQLIEIAAKAKLLDTLRGRGIKSVVETHRENMGTRVEKPITIAVPNMGTPKKGEVCQN